MILAYKKVGETPLELVDRIRREQPELTTETLSYAGRLDPMAEGQMIILVGDENSAENRVKFLGLDKEYLATFLVGMQTDTGDILGLIHKVNLEKTERDDEPWIKNNLEKIRRITKQTYPWFSGKAVGGIKLFDHFKAGNLDIERPSQDIQIKRIELLSKNEGGLHEESAADIKKYIFESIKKVRGDFRQKEILESWTDFFDSLGAQTRNESALQTLQTFQIKIIVSSGTFIRALTEQFDVPVVLLRLQRTAICSM